MNFDNLPDNLRVAGVAWVVSESLEYSDPSDTRVRAHYWAIMRGLPVGSADEHDAAAADADAYAVAHADEVSEFLAWRERERRRESVP